MTKFSELGLIDPILRAVTEQGYETPTPIQAKAIPPLLNGRDVLGIAQTGTGKTAAFALPILQRLSENGNRPGRRATRTLVLTPTRELAGQVADCFKTYGRHLQLRHTVVFGGVGINPQAHAVAKGVDVVVATPGRLLDLIGRGFLSLDNVEVFVLDEADRMLDMGFINDIKKIIARLPIQRQNLLFSATMPKEIHGLVDSILCDAVRVEATPPATTVQRVTQKVMFVAKADKRDLLHHILQDASVESAIIFTRTKHAANKVSEHLRRMGIQSEAIHGNKSQGARQRALDDFKSGKVRALVATDIAARGIDVDGVTHVVNFDLPNEPDAYVHRIGRTARAGSSGIALSFCDETELSHLKQIHRTIRQSLSVDDCHKYHSGPIARALDTAPEKVKGNGGNNGGNRGGQGGQGHPGRGAPKGGSSRNGGGRKRYNRAA